MECISSTTPIAFELLGVGVAEDPHQAEYATRSDKIAAVWNIRLKRQKHFHNLPERGRAIAYGVTPQGIRIAVALCDGSIMSNNELSSHQAEERCPCGR